VNVESLVFDYKAIIVGNDTGCFICGDVRVIS